MIPLTKNFCTKGYAHRMGSDVTKMQAAFNPSEETTDSISAALAAALVSRISLLPVMMIRRSTICRVNFVSSAM